MVHVTESTRSERWLLDAAASPLAPMALALALVLAVMLALGISPANEAWAASGAGLKAGAGAEKSVEVSTSATASVTVEAKRAMSGTVGVKAGSTYKLAPSATKGAKVTCKSNKPKVATVTNKGVVKALKSGTATITIKAKKGKKTATIKVKVKVVKAKQYKAVKSVAATTNRDTLIPGGTAKITATIAPAKATNTNVTYKSSNAAVLAVSASGEVTAKKAGTAKITVTSCANAKKKAAVTIRVVPSAGAMWQSSGYYSWADLKKIANAIAAAPSDAEGLAIAEAYCLVDKNGKLPTAVNSVQYYFMSADKTIYGDIRIIGFRHDTKTGGGKAGITFQVVGNTPIRHIINPLMPSSDGSDYWVSSGGSWQGSEMRAWLNNELYSMLPSDLTKHIVSVDKKTNSENRYSGVNIATTSDKLWLLSPAEIYSSVEGLTGTKYTFDAGVIETYKAEGNQYKLFKDNNVTTSMNGYGEEQIGPWGITLRSPYSSDQFLEINNDSRTGVSLSGTPTSYTGNGSEEFHLAPCFCF